MVLYWYYGGVGSEWDDVSNWWEDSSYSVPHAATPTNGDEVHIRGSTMPSEPPSSEVYLAGFDSSLADTGTSFNLSNISLNSGAPLSLGIGGDSGSNHQLSVVTTVGSGTLTLRGAAYLSSSGGYALSFQSIQTYDSPTIDCTDGVSVTANVELNGSTLWQLGDLTCGGTFTQSSGSSLFASVNATGAVNIYGGVYSSSGAVTILSGTGISLSGANVSATDNAVTFQCSSSIGLANNAVVEGNIVFNTTGTFTIDSGAAAQDTDATYHITFGLNPSSITLTNTGSTLYALYTTVTAPLTANTNTNVKANVVGNVTLNGTAQFTEGTIDLTSNKSLEVNGTAVIGAGVTGNSTSTVTLYGWAALYSSGAAFVGSGSSLTVTVLGADVLTIPSSKSVRLERVTLDFPDLPSGGGLLQSAGMSGGFQQS